MGTEFNLVSQEAQRALEEFSEEFAAALAQQTVEPWARTLGLYNTSRALKTTYPVPVSAAGYREFKGDMKYRALFEKSIELKPKTWQDGVEELASVIEAPDFTGWAGQPAAMAAAGASLPNEIIAGLLAANGTCWDGVNFFAANHPVNVFDASFGVFDNELSGDITDAGMTAAMQHFRQIKAPNGKPLGLRLTHIMVPAGQEVKARKFVTNNLMLQNIPASTTYTAVDNFFRGAVEVVVSDELTNQAEWYGLALNKPGMYPWIVQDEGAPEQLLLDKSSDHYKRTLKVAISYVMRGNGGLALPHCVVKMDGTD